MNVDAPWYVPNTAIRKNLRTRKGKEEIRQYSSQYSARLSGHSNDLVVNLMAQPDNRDCEYTCQALCLADSKCNCLICSLVLQV
jgi:hypothetical protein